MYQGYRQKLEIIRSGWFWFHLFIKPAVDADTLNIPHTLIEALTRRLNLIRKFEETRFAIFHFDELNYLEIPVSGIKETVDRFSRVIPDPPPFPPSLGLIGIPYSQASSLYLNCLIAHEMGHFVFEELALKDGLLPEIGSQLKEVSEASLDWSKDRLVSWAEELFCDLFAVWLVGPCYTMAYVEIFGLSTTLDPAALGGFSTTAGSVIFSTSHPADLFRLKQQVALLQELRWWNEVDVIKSHYVSVLRGARAVDESKFEFEGTEQQYSHLTLQAFLKLAPRVVRLVTEVMKDSAGNAVDSGLEGYKKFGNIIGQYLAEAVVPSTAFMGNEHWYPDIVALLNASMKFYLDSLEEPMKRIEGQKTSLAGHRSKWIKRVEALTSKAIEDHYLLVTEKGAVPDGGSFKRADLGPPESTDH